MQALIIIDMQNDFYNDELLELIPKINKLREKYEHVIFIIDWHPINHKSFDKKNKHCINDTYGAQIINGLIVYDTDIIIKKGQIESYDTNSIFYDAKDIQKMTRLLSIIEYSNIKEIHLCGNNKHGIINTSYNDAKKLEIPCIILNEHCTY